MQIDSEDRPDRAPAARRRGRGWAAAALVAAGLAGCATTPPSAGTAVTAETSASQTRRDLSVEQTNLPNVLIAARAAPYAPVGGGCADLERQVGELDLALGADFDRQPFVDKSESAGALAEDAARDVASAVIPFPNVLRYVTGSEQRQKAAIAAVLSGHIRRAYLKGLGEGRGCPPPATPARPPAAAPAQ